jgi:hypothetical protein
VTFSVNGHLFFFFEGIWGLCCSILVMSMRNTNRGLEKERMSRELIFPTHIYSI